MNERPGALPPDAPLPPHLDPRGRGSRAGLDRPSRPARPQPDARQDRPQRPEPELRPARPRSRRRVLRRIAIGLAVLLVVLTVGAVGSLAYYDRRIDRVAVPSLEGGDGGDTNYLLVGSDSRAGLTPEELVEVRTGLKGGGNEGVLTDTIVLLHVPDGGGEPSLISFPRDSWVEIPGYDRGRINTAYQLGEREAEGGGPALLVETVEQLSGLQVDHYLEIGFIAFLRLTDALGGVDVNLCAPAQDVKAGIDLPAGEQTLGGGDALGFVRQREGLPRGDLDRIERQQYFLGAVARQILSPGTLLRPDRAVGVLSAVTSSIRADEDLSTFDLARLGLRLRGALSGGLQFQTVPIEDANARVGGASVVLLDDEALPGFFADLSPETETEPPPAVDIPPSSIRLAVLNGTTRAGLAAEAAEALAGQGYTVSRTGNAEGGPTGDTLVLHGAGRADSARTVAASVPGAQLQQDDSVGENGLVLVVGDDYEGVRAVTVAPAGQPAPPPAGAPAPAAPAAPAEPAAPCID